MFTLLQYLKRRSADKAALQDDLQRKQGNIPEKPRGKRSKSRIPVNLLRDMARMSSVKLRMSDGEWELLHGMASKSDDMRQRFRDKRLKSGSMDKEPCDMSRESGNMQQESGDLLPKSPDIGLTLEVTEGMPEQSAGKAAGVWAAPLALMRQLRKLVIRQRDRISGWYWRLWGMEDPEYRRLFREAAFDELFEIEYTTDSRYQDLSDLFAGPWSGAWAPWIDYLEAERSLKRRARRCLAVLLAFIHPLLQRPEKKRRWTFTLRLALPALDLCGPLSPRPPPFAFH